MKTLKKIQVAKIFGIHPTTVTNYMEAAMKGRNNLILAENKGKYEVVDSPNNRMIIEQLREDGRKHKSKSTFKKVKVKDEFFKIFNKEQVAEIVDTLEAHKEISDKFTYFNGGAEMWHKYAEESIENNIKNTVTNTEEMLNLNFDYLVNQLKPGEKYNVFDIGIGDSAPVKRFLERLMKKKLLAKYVALDDSENMLKFSKENIKKWFGGEIKFETYVKDVNKDNLKSLLFYAKNSSPEKTRNLVLFLGSTIENQLNVKENLINLKNSILQDSILLVGNTTDNESGKTNFSIAPTSDHYENVPYQNKWVLDCLNIPSEHYKGEIYYNHKQGARLLEITLKSDIEITFEQLHKKIFFSKGTKIVLWRHAHHSAEDLVKLFSSAGLKVKHFITSKDQAQCITTCQLN